MGQAIETFLDHFGALEDKREQAKVRHPVGEILLVTLAGMVGGATGWEDIETFGAAKLEVLRGVLAFQAGVPSDDTLRRFFRAIDPQVFRDVFADFARSLLPSAAERLIAIDGTTLRGSRDGATKALHLVSAFATEVRLVLAQVKTDEKSNEIIAIPELLGLLDLRGATISIDAMGCQRAIAQKIMDGGGQFLLGLKGNQGTLHDDVRLLFKSPPSGTVFAAHEDHDKGHGRIETRNCLATDDIVWLQERHEWPGLRSLVQITATRRVGEHTSTDTRYYLTSLPPDPKRLLENTRSHWAIENNLHWTLDMTFGEDASRIRQHNAPLAIAVVRHVALNLLRLAQRPRESINMLRKKVGWDNVTLQRVLALS